MLCSAIRSIHSRTDALCTRTSLNRGSRYSITDATSSWRKQDKQDGVKCGWRRFIRLEAFKRARVSFLLSFLLHLSLNEVLGLFGRIVCLHHACYIVIRAGSGTGC